jgi:hypothetical protein
MPKATIVTKDGAKITIEGSVEEVRELMGRMHLPDKGAKADRKGRNEPKGRRIASMRDGILELKAEKFFNKPKGLAEIKDKLASLGMIYPVTSLSGAVLYLVKHRELGRVREDGRWCYVTR